MDLNLTSLIADSVASGMIPIGAVERIAGVKGEPSGLESFLTAMAQIVKDGDYHTAKGEGRDSEIRISFDRKKVYIISHPYVYVQGSDMFNQALTEGAKRAYVRVMYGNGKAVEQGRNCYQ